MRRHGFTLVELLIVVAIIAAVSAMVSIRFLRVNVNMELENATLEVMNLMQEARSRAISGHDAAGIKVSAWGVSIDVPGKSILLFADSNNDQIYTAGIDYAEPFYLNPHAELVSCTISRSGVSTPSATCSVTFPSTEGTPVIVPPLPSASPSPAPVAPDVAQLDLVLRAVADTSLTHTITVSSPAGLITSTVLP